MRTVSVPAHAEGCGANAWPLRKECSGHLSQAELGQWLTCDLRRVTGPSWSTVTPRDCGGKDITSPAPPPLASGENLGRQGSGLAVPGLWQGSGFSFKGCDRVPPGLGGSVPCTGIPDMG